MALPNPSMSFSPFAILTAEEMNDLVENIEALSAGTGLAAAAVTPDKWRNTYRFSVYRSTSWTDGNGGFALVTFNSETLDAGSNYDTSTGKFTAPVEGDYFFSAAASSTIAASNLYSISLYKNGVNVKQGSTGANAVINSGQRVVSGLIHLIAGDYVQVYSFGTGGAGNSGESATYFDGFLVSQT